MGTVGLLLTVLVPMRSLICRAMVKKACSTFVALFAEVSRKGIPRESANSYKSQISLCSRPTPLLHRSTYLCHCVFNDLLVRHIGLVAHQQLVDTLRCVAVDLLEPLLHVVEGVHVGNVVDHADAMGAAIVG